MKPMATLNADKTNAILICHALTGDQYVASTHPRTGKPGWWTRLVGEGKPVDPARHCIICINVLGSCMGSSGPASFDPGTGEPYAMDFPVITIADMVRAQAILLDHLGIERLACVIGGSMGGMQALTWASLFPDRVQSAIVIASTARHSAQNIAFHEVGRQAIMADPRLARRQLLWFRRPARRRLSSRADGGAYHLPLRRRPDAEIRAAVARPRKQDLWFRRRFPGRKLFAAIRGLALSSASTPIAISISPARWTITTSPKSMAAFSPRPFRARAPVSA
jgi:pimeloyl-ACP methyl ester carboxylesterase